MREGASLKSAAAEYGVDPRTVVMLGGSALRKTKGGRYAAKPSDKLLRPLVVPVHGGRIEVGGPRLARRIGTVKARNCSASVPSNRRRYQAAKAAQDARFSMRPVARCRSSRTWTSSRARATSERFPLRASTRGVADAGTRSDRRLAARYARPASRRQRGSMRVRRGAPLCADLRPRRRRSAFAASASHTAAHRTRTTTSSASATVR